MTCYERQPEVRQRKFQEYKARRKTDPDYDRRVLYKTKYNLTVERYEELFQSQSGGCAICGGVNPHGIRLHIDHDHACCPGLKSCGSCVRGLLCTRCNQAIGQLREDPFIIESALFYLNSHKNLPPLPEAVQTPTQDEEI